MRKYLATLVFILIGSTLLLSCRPTEPIYPLEPQVLVLSPASDSVLAPGPVTVKVWVENLNLVDKVGQSNVPGEGHLIYYLDVLPPVKMGEPATTAAGTYVVSTNTNYTWPNLTSGKHTLAVQVVNNDNTPIRYPSAVRVYVTVK
jgi:hypothetical protein